jgi:hypothetical protein
MSDGLPVCPKCGKREKYMSTESGHPLAPLIRCPDHGLIQLEDDNQSK